MLLAAHRTASRRDLLENLQMKLLNLVNDLTVIGPGISQHPSQGRGELLVA
jgi:hypothetical protein